MTSERGTASVVSRSSTSPTAPAAARSATGPLCRCHDLRPAVRAVTTTTRMITATHARLALCASSASRTSPTNIAPTACGSGRHPDEAMKLAPHAATATGSRRQSWCFMSAPEGRASRTSSARFR